MPPAKKRKKLAKPKMPASLDLQNGDIGNTNYSDPEDDEEAEEARFPIDKLRRIFAYMLSSTEDRREFITRFSDHIDNEDVQSGGLEALAAVSATIPSPPTLQVASNLFNVLKLFRVRAPKWKRLLSGAGGSGDDPTARAHFDTLWLRLLELPLSPLLYRRVLTALPERVLPHLTNPLRLTDFLLASYQLGGVISVLALNGVFYLMQHHNLEYPDFYSKLYSLLTPDAVRSPQRGRFFKLVDLFLGSGYLPEYLVAAFVKRVSRLTLTAPAPAQPMLIRLACSLMVRHRGLQKLTDDPRGATELPEDPYREEEPDPARCGAADSALWEIKSLRNHLVPALGRAASFVDRELPELEHPLAELLETSYDDLLEAEFTREMKDVALTFHRPEGLLSWKEDRLAANWKL